MSSEIGDNSWVGRDIREGKSVQKRCEAMLDLNSTNPTMV